MRWRLALLTAAPFAMAIGAGQLSAQSSADAQQRRLVEARARSAAAAARALKLQEQAGRERDAEARARAEEAAVAARVEAAAADVGAATARVALVDRLLADQNARLAGARTPLAELLAALQSLALRPAVVALAQPGSVDDLVHVRAVLGAAMPAIAARTAGLRSELDRTRQLRAGAALAATSLADGRARLEAQRLALTQLVARHRARSTALDRSALTESDRAIALGEQARDLVDRMSLDSDAAETGQALAALPGPLPRPDPAGAGGPILPWTRASPPYRLPVAGRLVTGLGELDDAGVGARGLTFAVAASAPVIAPAAATVRYAGPFRGFGAIVILDHGGGWTTLLTGLDRLFVIPGQRIAQGAEIGRARTGDEPRVTVELRRRDRPVDLVPLTG